VRSFIGLILFEFLLVFPPVLLTAGKVAAETDITNWYAYIYVGVSGAYKRLVVGQDERATEGHDDFWESPVPKMFLESGIIRPYFYHPEWRKSSPFFWRDMRPLGGLPMTWEFIVKTKRPNVNVRLKWDLSWVKENIRLYLKKKEDAKYINLHKSEDYTFQSVARENVFLVKAEQIIQH
jgi:hypothetical protein